MNKPIYMDHAATTPLDPRVLEKMTPYLTDVYGNANSQHAFGRAADRGVDEARDTNASLIGAKPSEIYFTSGGTEADNWALKGIMAAQTKKKHLIVSAIEHAAMLETAKQLSKAGYEVSCAPVDEFGRVDLDALRALVREDTALVGVMAANNEVGTIQPVGEIAAIAHAKGALMFTDAVQAAGVLELDVRALGVDLMSASAHKIYGPKGVGMLYVRNGVKIENLIAGGHQERTRRGGTTNVPGVVGFAEAFRLAAENIEANNAYVTALRDRLIDRVQAEVPDVKLNGHRTLRLPANADFSFRYIEGESVLFSLDLAGIAVSSGSACSSGSLEPSHVLLAMGLPEELAHGSIRFTLGKHNTEEEVDYTVESLKAIVARLRDMSPLFSAAGGEGNYV